MVSLQSWFIILLISLSENEKFIDEKGARSNSRAILCFDLKYGWLQF